MELQCQSCSHARSTQRLLAGANINIGLILETNRKKNATIFTRTVLATSVGTRQYTWSDKYSIIHIDKKNLDISKPKSVEQAIKNTTVCIISKHFSVHTSLSIMTVADT